MRILLHDLTGHPFQIQLSRQLAKNGHQVLHSFGQFFQGPKGALQTRPDDPTNLTIEGIQLNNPFHKYSFVKRFFQEVSYGRLLIKQADEFKPDVMLFANTPSEVEWIVCRHFRKQPIKMIHWVQDVYGVAINKLLRKKIPLLGYFIGQLFLWFDRQLAHQSDQIVLISEDFRPLFEQWQVPPRKIHVVPNWAPLEEMPVRNKYNKWARRQQFDRGFNFLYAGTLGMKHNPALLLKLAIKFKSHPEKVRVIVVSEGLGANWLRDKKEERQLENLILLPYQPFEDLPDVLGTADVLLAILEPDAGVFSVPSKVLTYLCAQRPLLLAVPPENLAARVVRQNEAGFVVSPQDKDGFIDKAAALYENTKLREKAARNGRIYAEKHFDINKIAIRFEEILKGCFNAPD